jgi:hypothetical protein
LVAAFPTEELVQQVRASPIPIVFGTGGDPVGRGLVASINRPGGNATGVNKICRWYLQEKEAWERYFRDMEPIEQELIKYMSSRFRVFLQRQEDPGSDAVRISDGSRLATILDQNLADPELPLLDVARWYYQVRLAARDIEEKDLSETERAAWNLGGGDFESETGIDPRNCECTRPDPNVCKCLVRLKAARTVLARAHSIGVFS